MRAGGGMEEDGLVMSISLGGEIEDALESALKPMRSAGAENQDFQLRTRRRRVPATAMQHISATQHFFDFNKYYLYYAIFDYYYCLFYKY